MSIQRWKAVQWDKSQWIESLAMPTDDGPYVTYAEILKWAQDQYDDCLKGETTYDRGSIIHKAYMDQRFAFGQLLNFLGDKS